MKMKHYAMVVVTISVFLVGCTMRNDVHSRRARASNDCVELVRAIEEFKTGKGVLPEKLADLNGGEDHFLEILIKDPWGNDYILKTNVANDIIVLSAGADAVSGTSDDIQATSKMPQQTLPPVSGTRGTPAADAPVAPRVPER